MRSDGGICREASSLCRFRDVMAERYIGLAARGLLCSWCPEMTLRRAIGAAEESSGQARCGFGKSSTEARGCGHVDDPFGPLPQEEKECGRDWNVAKYSIERFLKSISINVRFINPRVQGSWFLY